MWFWWGIISAIFASVSTIYIKHSLKRISPVLITWAIIVFPIPVLIALCLPNPINSLNLLFWVGVCSSALFFTFAKLWSTQAVQVGLLSKLMPLSCFGTFFLYIWGLIFLGEQITIINFLGMTCIISGAYFLNIESVHEGFWQPITLLFKNKNTMLYLLAMLIGSFVSIFDKTALNNVSPSNPNFTYLMENIVTVIVSCGINLCIFSYHTFLRIYVRPCSFICSFKTNTDCNSHVIKFLYICRQTSKTYLVGNAHHVSRSGVGESGIIVLSLRG